MSSVLKPDADIIRLHLHTLFKRCADEYSGGKIQLDCGDPNTKGWGHDYFNSTPEGLDNAVQWAVDWNNKGRNIYVGVNPRKPGTFPGAPAKNDDVEISFFNFADLDTQEAINQADDGEWPILNTYSVTTGTIPNRRVHLYWEREDAMRNLKVWRDVQSGIADHFKGDPVIDPRRIMRLAGAVNYPSPKKVERGYVEEVVTLTDTFEDEYRAPVDGLELHKLFGKSTEPQNLTSASTGLNFDTGTHLNVSNVIQAIERGEEWHNNVIRLVAHWVSHGWPDFEIMMMCRQFTQQGYTHEDTDREVKKAINGARKKGFAPETSNPSVSADVGHQSKLKLLTVEDLRKRPPPEFRIDDILPEKGVAVIGGQSGHMKTFLAITLGFHVATGRTLGPCNVKKTDVLFCVNEGQAGLGTRCGAWLQSNDEVSPHSVRIIEGTPSLAHDDSVEEYIALIEDADYHPEVIFLDTLSKATLGMEESSNSDMAAAIGRAYTLADHFGAVVVLIDHVGKDAKKGLRGAYAKFANTDAVLMVNKTGNTVSLKTDKVKEGEDGKSFYFEIDIVDVVHPETGEVKSTPVLIPQTLNLPVPQKDFILNFLGHEGAQHRDTVCKAFLSKYDGKEGSFRTLLGRLKDARKIEINDGVISLVE